MSLHAEFSLPQVKISLKRAAFSNSRRNSVCSDKGVNNTSKLLAWRA
jgi:hypothetical protein